MENDTGSDFGKGLCYCLGLFVAHEAKLYSLIQENRRLREMHPRDNLFTDSYAVSLWFNGAADHLFELQVDSTGAARTRKRLAILQLKCLEWRNLFPANNQPTIQDAEWALQEAKNLLRLIDKANGVETIKGNYE